MLVHQIFHLFISLWISVLPFEVPDTYLLFLSPEWRVHPILPAFRVLRISRDSPCMWIKTWFFPASLPDIIFIIWPVIRSKREGKTFPSFTACIQLFPGDSDEQSGLCTYSTLILPVNAQTLLSHPHYEFLSLLFKYLQLQGTPHLLEQMCLHVLGFRSATLYRNQSHQMLIVTLGVIKNKLTPFPHQKTLQLFEKTYIPKCSLPNGCATWQSPCTTQNPSFVFIKF